MSFRSRETLFIPPARWQTTRRAHYRRLGLPQDSAAFLEPLIERAKAGVLAVSKTAAEGILRVDEELHLTPLEPLAEDPKVTKLRASRDRPLNRRTHLMFDRFARSFRQLSNRPRLANKIATFVENDMHFSQ